LLIPGSLAYDVPGGRRGVFRLSRKQRDDHER
jgi:hypothetical protein